MQNEQDWRKLSIQTLDDEYQKYKEFVIETCRNKDRNLQYDYNSKYGAIRDFPMEIFLKRLHSELTVSKVKYDSIIGINKFYHLWDEVEYPTKQIIFLIFHKGKIYKRYQVDLYNSETKIYKEKDVLDKHYLELLKTKNGCDASLLLITCFYKNTIKIRKIAINPEKLMYLDPAKAPHD